MIAERNDPTHAGFSPPAAGDVRLSCNEAEAQCVKAARGAGYGWGLAEEAGFAARWLHARGLDGLSALLAHLDREATEATGLTLSGGAFRAEGAGHLCPIAVGAAVSDFAALGQRRFTAGRADRPLLLLPFLHQAAQSAKQPMALAWDGGQVTVSPAAEIRGEVRALVQLREAAIAIGTVDGESGAALAQGAPAHPPPRTVERLNAYAMRTTVPATDASRADAGSVDGDDD